MPGGGEITLMVQQDEVEANAVPGLTAGQYIHLTVTDTGTGMDAVTLARAIEPFYSTKEQGRGTGLGLSMVHGLAAQLGGAFRLRSVPGEGTRACLYLPLAGPEALGIRPPAMAAIPVPMSPLSILLVDDEDVVRSATMAMLRDMGHSVAEATGGNDALERLSTGLRPDVVITDFKMPRMSGAELADHVRRKWPALPLLIVTGYVGDDKEVKGIPVLAKPFRQADLAAALIDAVAQSRRPAVEFADR